MANDNTPKRPPLMSLDEALDHVLKGAIVIPEHESVPSFEADGRVLAEDLVSQLQVPPQDNSSMDGYAIRLEDVPVAGARLKVTQRIPAGHNGQALQAGEAARIFTGAPIPPGANAVVMQEDTQLDSSTEVPEVAVQVIPSQGQWIRRSGEDVTRGAVVLPKGTRLDPAALGLAASIGVAKVKVVRRPRVALFSTGDELVMPGDVEPQNMRPGAIYNSNRFFLRALLVRAGCDVTDLGIVPDNLSSTLQAMKTAAANHDLILTSGGVSVGEEDHVKPAVEALGGLNLWQISMKPGKPFAFGFLNPQGACASNKTYFMGLPGNPVSSFVTFQLLVRPFLLALQGVAAVRLTPYRLQAHFDLPKPDKRREFLRVKRNAQGGVELFPNQSSGVLTSVVWGDGVVDNPGAQAIQVGDWVSFYPFAEWLQ
ncbi:gephyrin-like molybdotransferase Glp [Limnohabitans sp. Hippo4]|uniref:molybdopterin molybdotransferase MoeA n=1 Tax=Limnohabitans sp. Hippo4 TaxID=1826167 RepID=UPI000D36DDA6|nr:gephyrin-like molybdotransferase Glp [Limnohabitans sp. Hippo4]PUE36672.1 molybdopterin molybdenumtransferase MoeA [Limnohabitans sp. Hippo4]